MIDRDQDGWGEVLFLQAGYEGFTVAVREYSADGFEPARLTYWRRLLKARNANTTQKAVEVLQVGRRPKEMPFTRPRA